MLTAAAVTAMTPLYGQSAKLQFNLDHLIDKASETVNVTLDKSMLGLVHKFIPDKDRDAARVKNLISGLEGVFVRVFEFDKPGQYSLADVEAVRKQMKAPGWHCIVEVRSRRDGDNVDVCLRQDGEKILGLGVLVAEPQELAVVNIVGPIRPEDLADLEGTFKIPRLPAEAKEALRRREAEKEKTRPKDDGSEE